MRPLYNTHGHKLRFPPSEKTQFTRRGLCLTGCGIAERANMSIGLENIPPLDFASLDIV